MPSTSPESQFEFTQRERERSKEAQEIGFEMDEQAEAAAAMERADMIVKDVQSTKQQMKNIMMSMHAVQQQIRELRKLLDLADAGDASSVEQDKKRIDELKGKISEYHKELFAMKDDLIREQIAELESQGIVGDIPAIATQKIAQLIHDVTNDT